MVNECEQATGFLAALPPFDFILSLRFLEGFAPTKSEQKVSSNQITKAVSIARRALVFSVAVADNEKAPGVHYQLYGAGLDANLVAQAERIIANFLGLQDDLEELYRVGEQDPAFAPVLKKLLGYHQVRFLTPFENAVWSVLSQRTPMMVAVQLKGRLAAQYGPKLSLPDKDNEPTKYQAFPESEAIAQVSEAELSELLGNSRKANYVLNVAQAFSTTLRMDETDKLTREALKTRLLAIKGIGEWSAEFILIRGFGRMGGLPKGEKRHMEIVSRRYAKGQSVTEADIERFAKPYGESQGYWAHYLRVAG